MSLTKDFLTRFVPDQPGQPEVAPSHTCIPSSIASPPGGSVGGGTGPAPPPNSSPPPSNGTGSITCSTLSHPEMVANSSGQLVPSGRTICITVCVDEVGRIAGLPVGSYC